MLHMPHTLGDRSGSNPNFIDFNPQFDIQSPPVFFYKSDLSEKNEKGGSRKSLTLHAWWMLVLGMRERNGS